MACKDGLLHLLLRPLEKLTKICPVMINALENSVIRYLVVYTHGTHQRVLFENSRKQDPSVKLHASGWEVPF